MGRLHLFAVDVFAPMCHKPRWNSPATLHPSCDWGRLEVSVTSGILRYDCDKPCVYYEGN